MNYSKKKALQLILLFGLVSLFGDIVYEGARSVNGPYLKLLGANAVMVGIIAGIGEFLGYTIRLVSGYVSDKTKNYWLFTILGYALIIAVPLLAYTSLWHVAALFIVVERIGKALRSPAKDTLLSQATKQVGTGFGFGLNELMDQIGALVGPLIFTFFFMIKGAGERTLADYQHGYGLLWIPFALLMLCVVVAWRSVPHPEALETEKKNEPEKLPKVFWIYTIFSFLTTMGFVNFVLLAFHYKARHILTDFEIPLYYALAMGIDGVAALVIGKAYDVQKEKKGNDLGGLSTLIIIPLFSILIPLLAFSENRWVVIPGILIWGIVMACHETIMKSAIADITPLKKRGTGYGILNTAYGLAVLAGSTLMGFFYDRSLAGLIFFAIALELTSLPFFFAIKKEMLSHSAAS
ncbi:MAG TPA: MFS transporter [Candidatus Omnitrophota bacterium]|nr:MFS transporter [Candidatus Omnitrophota bacterium]